MQMQQPLEHITSQNATQRSIHAPLTVHADQRRAADVPPRSEFAVYLFTVPTVRNPFARRRDRIGQKINRPQVKRRLISSFV
jgi:hypothetical protein